LIQVKWIATAALRLYTPLLKVCFHGLGGRKMVRVSLIFSILALMLPMSEAMASETPQEARHELMEGVKDAAKPVGQMLKGEQEFDAAVAMESFQTWAHAAGIFGDLFPAGSDTGYDTEAKATIWTDREGFDEKLQAFAKAVNAAIEADPQDLEALKAAAGPVFKACKSCHESYRVEDED
jgi:cytochrome c556